MIPWSTRLLRDEDLEAGRGDSLGSDSGQPVTSLVLCRSFLILGPEVNSDWRGQDERAGEHGPGQPGHPEVILIPVWVPCGMRTVGISELWNIMM